MFRDLPRLIVIAVLGYSLVGCAGLASRDGEQAAETSPKPQAQQRLLLQARVAQREGRLHNALNGYRQILRSEPGHTRANIGAGQVLLAMHRPNDALPYFDRVLQQSPDLAIALEGRGYALLGLNRLRMAEQALGKAVNLNPARWRSWSGLGVIADLHGDSKKAQAFYEKALLVLPGQPQLLNNRAFSLMLMRNYGQAEVLLKKALEQDVDDVRIRNNLAWCLAWQRRYNEALKILVPPLSPAQARNNVGYIAMQQGDLSTATAMFREAMKLSPVFYERAANNLEEAQRRLRHTPEH